MANGDGRSEFFSSKKNSNYSEDNKMKVLLSIINIINSLRAPPKLILPFFGGSIGHVVSWGGLETR